MYWNAGDSLDGRLRGSVSPKKDPSAPPARFPACVARLRAACLPPSSGPLRGRGLSRSAPAPRLPLAESPQPSSKPADPWRSRTVGAAAALAADHQHCSPPSDLLLQLSIEHSQRLLEKEHSQPRLQQAMPPAARQDWVVCCSGSAGALLPQSLSA